MLLPVHAGLTLGPLVMEEPVHDAWSHWETMVRLCQTWQGRSREDVMNGTGLAPNLSDVERTFAVLTLKKMRGIARKTVVRILLSIGGQVHTHSDLKESVRVCKQTPRSLRDLDHEEFEREWSDAEAHARRTIDWADKHGVVILVSGGEGFPRTIGSIDDPPVLLYVRGLRDLLDRPDSVAIIGTREPSVRGRRAAKDTADLFATKGWVVVSGLAVGCDSIAHLSCVELTGGQTVAVLANPLEKSKVYPAENRDLALRILDQGGAWVSENGPFDTITKGSFVERDRLQSGFASAVVLIESSVSGGSMHASRACLAQGNGRLLAVVSYEPKPGDSERVNDSGNLSFLQETPRHPAVRELKAPNSLEALLTELDRQRVSPRSEVRQGRLSIDPPSGQ